MGRLGCEGWRASGGQFDGAPTGNLPPNQYFFPPGLLAAKGWTASSSNIPPFSGTAFYAPSMGGAGTSGYTYSVGQPTFGGTGNLTWTPTGFVLPATFIVAFRAKWVLANVAVGAFILNMSSIGLSLRVAAGNQIALYSNSGTLLGTTASVPAPLDGNSHHYEFQLTIDNTVGAFQLFLDAVSILNLAGVNTGAGAAASIAWIAPQPANSGFGSGSTLALGDVDILDTTGAHNNAPLGDRYVETCLPTSDGTHQDFVPSSGGNHYSRVNETPPDGDTSYVSSSTLGDKDSYGHEALSVGAGTVYGIVAYAVGRKTDTPPRGIKALVRSAASEVVGAEKLLAQSWWPAIVPPGNVAAAVVEVDPNGGGAWTVATVNASQIGVTVST